MVDGFSFAKSRSARLSLLINLYWLDEYSSFCGVSVVVKQPG